ncbi:hypothetical protein TGCAST_202220 [Toxoplasma gondii CAST]|uniref:Uncharacterized protein n=1 Tax=Toxoplasma gondii CAST TaxID=943122 RepID=A0A425I3I0_TOXGO|nr:hypothetical protein TGCAST_202220 [Toxoplasma gondii CAST]
MAHSEISLFAEQLDELCGGSVSSRAGRRDDARLSTLDTSILRGRQAGDAHEPRRKNRCGRSVGTRDRLTEAALSPTAAACEAALLSCNSFNSYRLATVIPPEPGRGTWEGDNFDADPESLSLQEIASRGSRRPLRRVPQRGRHRSLADTDVSKRPLLSTAQLVALLNARSSGNSVSPCSRGDELSFFGAEAGAVSERKNVTSSLAGVSSLREGLASTDGGGSPHLWKDSGTVCAGKEALLSADLEYPFSARTPISAALANDVLTAAAAAAAKEEAAALQSARDALGSAVFRQAVATAKAEEEQKHLLQLLAKQAEQQAVVSRELESLRNSQKALAQQQEQLQLKQDLLQRQEASNVYAQLQRERDILENQHAKLLKGFSELQLQKATLTPTRDNETGLQVSTEISKLQPASPALPSSVSSPAASHASSPLVRGVCATAERPTATTTRLSSSPAPSSKDQSEAAPLALKVGGAPRGPPPEQTSNLPVSVHVSKTVTTPPMPRVSPDPRLGPASGPSPIRVVRALAGKQPLICTEKQGKVVSSTPVSRAPRVSYPGLQRPFSVPVQHLSRQAASVATVSPAASRPSEGVPFSSSKTTLGGLCAAVCCGGPPSTISSPHGMHATEYPILPTVSVPAAIRSSSVPLTPAVGASGPRAASQGWPRAATRPLQTSLHSTVGAEVGAIVGSQHVGFDANATTVSSSSASPVPRVYYRTRFGARAGQPSVTVPVPPHSQPGPYVTYRPLFAFPQQSSWLSPLSVPGVVLGPPRSASSDTCAPPSPVAPVQAGTTPVNPSAPVVEFCQPVESERGFSPLLRPRGRDFQRERSQPDRRRESFSNERGKQPENSTISGTEGWVKFESPREEPWELEDAASVSGRVLELRHQRRQLQKQRQALLQQHFEREEVERERMKRKEEEDRAVVKKEQKLHRCREGDCPEQGSERSPSVSGVKTNARRTGKPEKQRIRTATTGVQTGHPAAASASQVSCVFRSSPAASPTRQGRGDVATLASPPEFCHWPQPPGTGKEACLQTRLQERWGLAAPGNSSDMSAVTAAAAAAAAEAARTAARRAADGVQEAAAAILEPIQPIQKRLVQLFGSRAPSRRENMRRYVLPQSTSHLTYYYPSVGVSTGAGPQGMPPYAWGVPRVVTEATR